LPRGLERLAALSKLNIAAILLGTMGGFGLVFAATVSPMIRAYNRISVYIAFFSLAALALLADAIRRRLRTRPGRAAFRLALAAALGAGLLDQTTPSLVPDHAGAARVFAGDRAFVRGVEATLPRRAMIFQLPYVPFPENGFVHRMYDYDHFRPYFHSD